MRALLLAACATLLAGCLGNGQIADPDVVSVTFTHDFAAQDPSEEPFILNVTAELSYQVTFLGLPAPGGSGWVCPLEGTDVAVALVTPENEVSESFAPDVRGLTGGEDCGGAEGGIKRAGAGTWKVRFSGEDRANAIVTLIAVGVPG